MRASEFIRAQKILRIATVDGSGNPHIVPVWYGYSAGKFYIGTNTRTEKAKNIMHNPRVSFCIDVGVRSPDIFGVMGTGRARLLLKDAQVRPIAKKILLRYFRSLENNAAKQLLADTDCIIEITPRKIVSWKF